MINGMIKERTACRCDRAIMTKEKKVKKVTQRLKSSKSPSKIPTKTLHDPFATREAEKYPHPIPSREYLLEHLSSRGRPATYQNIQDELDLHGFDEAEALRRRLIAMV